MLRLNTLYRPLWYTTSHQKGSSFGLLWFIISIIKSLLGLSLTKRDYLPSVGYIHYQDPPSLSLSLSMIVSVHTEVVYTGLQCDNPLSVVSDMSRHLSSVSILRAQAYARQNPSQRRFYGMETGLERQRNLATWT